MPPVVHDHLIAGLVAFIAFRPTERIDATGAASKVAASVKPRVAMRRRNGVRVTFILSSIQQLYRINCPGWRKDTAGAAGETMQ